MYFLSIFIKRRAQLEKKYYKIFIENPTYLRNQGTWKEIQQITV